MIGSPWKAVHHVTEGDSAQGAFAAYRGRKVAPHFTVAGEIWQHLDTDVPARSLKNLRRGVETNRARALQFELVGWTGKDKDRGYLANVARLCRWLEVEFGIADVWPSGPPRFNRDGSGDPGGHNRSVENWLRRSGHFGHSQVPENAHYDPGYSPEELVIVMGQAPAPAREPIAVLVNGIQVGSGYLEEPGHAWVWVRAVADALGATLAPRDETITLFRAGSKAELPMRIENGRGFVPAADLSALPGVRVTWDPAKRAVEIVGR